LRGRHLCTNAKKISIVSGSNHSDNQLRINDKNIQNIAKIKQSVYGKREREKKKEKRNLWRTL
jgi:hypothetical protein